MPRPAHPALLPALAGLWAAGLVALLVAVQRPAPLFVNLGAGDGPFARGFRGGWERDGLTGAGETMFRWTEDGSRLELPLSIHSGHLRLRMRMARFAPGRADVTLSIGGREVDRWTQPSRGWLIREVDLGAVRGRFSLTFRSAAASGDPLGVAIDWVEVRGAGRVVPDPGVTGRLALLLLGVPLAAALVLGDRRVGAGLGTSLAWVGAMAVACDRLGGLVALAAGAAPALGAVALVSLAVRRLAGWWPDLMGRRAAPVALLAVVLAVVGLFHPFYYYPDVDTHLRLSAAMKANPLLIVDPTQPWARRGDWTRTIGGNPVAIPYAVVFHALAWPLAPLLGEAASLKALAVALVGLTLVLVHALARAAGAGGGTAVLAQALAATMPVLASRLSLALYPTLLGLAAFVLLLVHLCRRLDRLDGRRDVAAAAAFVAMASAVYTGTIVMVALFVFAVAAVETAAGEWRRAARLLAAWAMASAAVGLMYVGFVPVLVRDVLPHLGAATPVPGDPAAVAPAGSPLALGARRGAIFFGTAYPLLLLPGGLALRQAPAHARRALLATLAVGLAILGLRFVASTVLRDAKEVELLLAPVAVLAASGLALLWRHGRTGRLVAVAGGAWALGWGLTRSAAVYLERFLAVGR